MNLLAPGTTFASLVGSIIGLINATIPVLIAAAVVFFMLGAVKYVRSQGEKKNRDMIVWSLVALFVIVSVWGILRLACATFTSSASCSSSVNYNESAGGYQIGGPSTGGGAYPL